VEHKSCVKHVRLAFGKVHYYKGSYVELINLFKLIIYTYINFYHPIVIIASKPVQAQIEDNRELLSFGLKAGLKNLSNVCDSKGEDFVADPKYEVAGGAFVSLSLGKYLGFQPELMISQKGYKGSGSLLGFTYSNMRTTTFHDVPLLVQFKPIKYLSILAEPQLSYLLKEKNLYTFGSNSTE
jgi:hypothetical protein